MKKSVLVVSMMVAIAPFGLQALSLNINGTDYPNVTLTSVITTQTGVWISAEDPNNELGGGGGGVEPDDPQAPNAFGFTAKNDVAVNTLIPSNTVTIGGIGSVDPSDISVTNGEYCIGVVEDCDSNATWTNAPGTIVNDDTVTVRHTTAASNNTQTTTTLTIGGVSGLFRTTTEAAVGACGVKPENVTESDVLDWTSPGGRATISLVGSEQIYSTRFVSTGNPEYLGQISVSETSSSGNYSRQVWISTCPGAPAVSLKCSSSGAVTTVLRWGQDPTYRYCKLDLNTEYYINTKNVDCPAGKTCSMYRTIYTNGNP